MPLEILIDTKEEWTGRARLICFEKVDFPVSLHRFAIFHEPAIDTGGRIEICQAGIFENDSTQYGMPDAFDGAF